MTSQAWVEVEDAELGEKLLDMKSMMHLRKGAFEEAVRKASEAMADVDVRRIAPIAVARNSCNAPTIRSLEI